MNQAALIEHLNFTRDPTAESGLFAARWHGPIVWRDFPLGHRGCFQELSKGLCPAASVLHHTVPPALHKHTLGIIEKLRCCSAGRDLHTGCATPCESCAIVPLRTDLLWRLYLLFTLVLDSLYHRLISMPPEMSIAKPPWNSALAFRPDCSWITWPAKEKQGRRKEETQENVVKFDWFSTPFDGATRWMSDLLFLKQPLEELPSFWWSLTHLKLTVSSHTADLT